MATKGEMEREREREMPGEGNKQTDGKEKDTGTERAKTSSRFTSLCSRSCGVGNVDTGERGVYV